MGWMKTPAWIEVTVETMTRIGWFAEGQTSCPVIHQNWSANWMTLRVPNYHETSPHQIWSSRQIEELSRMILTDTYYASMQWRGWK